MNLSQRRAIARREKVKDLYEQDIPVSLIAEHLEVSQPTIYKDLLILGLRFKGTYSPAQRAAISNGLKIRNAQRLTELKTPRICCVCGVPAMKRRFRQKYYCEKHLRTAGDHDPQYEVKQRLAAGDRFASSGRMEGV
ncbi:MAG: hypothetical protein U9Q07_03975 [Planctomycetota bacterium]|nr:hypothetical protein [Planctomycetota bacterium]